MKDFENNDNMNSQTTRIEMPVRESEKEEKQTERRSVTDYVKEIISKIKDIFKKDGEEGSSAGDLFVERRGSRPFGLELVFTVFKVMVVMILLLGCAGMGLVTGVAKAYVETTEDIDPAQLSKSDRTSYIYDKDGVCGEKIDYLLKMRSSGSGKIKDYADKFGVEYHEGEKPWGNVKVDVCMPCATQNEITLKDAEKIVSMGIKIVNEVSNMPTTLEAMEFLQKSGVTVCPSKAVNAGGVATSGLEMTQKSERLSWTKEEVDAKLKGIMQSIYKQIVDALNEYGLGYDLVAGANLAGFKKVADAMIAQGIY